LQDSLAFLGQYCQDLDITDDDEEESPPLPSPKSGKKKRKEKTLMCIARPDLTTRAMATISLVKEFAKSRKQEHWMVSFPRVSA
jgi:hypothetical protein